MRRSRYHNYAMHKKQRLDQVQWFDTCDTTDSGLQILVITTRQTKSHGEPASFNSNISVQLHRPATIQHCNINIPWSGHIEEIQLFLVVTCRIGTGGC